MPAGAQQAPSGVAAKQGPQPLSGWNKAKAIAQSPRAWWKTRNWNPAVRQQSADELPVAGQIEPASPAANGPSQNPLPSLSQLAGDEPGTMNNVQPSDKPKITGMPDLPDFAAQDDEPIYEPPEAGVQPNRAGTTSPKKPKLTGLKAADVYPQTEPQAGGEKELDMPSLAAAAGQPTKGKGKGKGKKEKPMKMDPAVSTNAQGGPEMPPLASLPGEQPPEEYPETPSVDLPALYNAAMKTKKQYGSWKVGDTVTLGKAGYANVTDKIGNRYYLAKDDGRQYVFIPFKGMYPIKGS